MQLRMEKIKCKHAKILQFYTYIHTCIAYVGPPLRIAGQTQGVTVALLCFACDFTTNASTNYAIVA